MSKRLAWITLFVLFHPARLGATQSLSFLGNETFKDTVLAKFLSNETVDKDSAGSDQAEVVSLLFRFYRNRGFPLVSITCKEANGGHTFEIVEGPRARLQQVSFEGNSVFFPRNGLANSLSWERGSTGA